MKFKTKPWKHQVEALKYFIDRHKKGLTFGTLFTDMGSGKTKIMIDLINNLQFNFTLIVAPKKSAELVWESEIKKHSYNESIVVFNAVKFSSIRKVEEVKCWLNLTNKTTKKILIVNYDSVWREPFRSFLLKLSINCVICDELHRIKAPGSKVSRFLHLLSKQIKHRYGMTGTPLAQSPLDIYAQYRFINDSIFGTNMKNFTDEYANMRDMGNYRIPDKRNPYKNLDKLKEKMFSCAFTMESEVELPPTQEILIEYNISSKLEKIYRQIQKEGCLEAKNGILEVKNVISLITRLQQIMNGYIPLTNLDTGETFLEEFDTTRQEILQELLEGINPSELIVIFCKYRKDIKDIRKVCKNINRDCAEISGSMNEFQIWGNKPQEKTVLVVQIQAGAEALDFTAARYCIDYDLHYSLLLWKQSRKRIHRPGQTRPVVYYTIIAKMKKGLTIDERIYKSLISNGNLIKEIMNGNSL